MSAVTLRARRRSCLGGLASLSACTAVGGRNGPGPRNRFPVRCSFFPVLHLQSFSEPPGAIHLAPYLSPPLCLVRLATVPAFCSSSRTTATPALPLFLSPFLSFPPSTQSFPPQRFVEHLRHDPLPSPHRRRCFRCHRHRLPALFLILSGGGKAFAPPAEEAAVEALSKRVRCRSRGGRRRRRPTARGAIVPRAGRRGRGRGGVLRPGGNGAPVAATCGRCGRRHCHCRRGGGLVLVDGLSASEGARGRPRHGRRRCR